jgi:hypothetical protein
MHFVRYKIIGAPKKFKTGCVLYFSPGPDRTCSQLLLYMVFEFCRLRRTQQVGEVADKKAVHGQEEWKTMYKGQLQPIGGAVDRPNCKVLNINGSTS